MSFTKTQHNVESLVVFKGVLRRVCVLDVVVCALMVRCV